MFINNSWISVVNATYPYDLSQKTKYQKLNDDIINEKNYIT